MLKLARLLLALLIATTGSLVPVQARMGFDTYGSGRLTMPSTKQLANRFIPTALFWTPAALGANLKVWFALQSDGTYKDLSGNNHTLTGPDANGGLASDAGWTVAQPLTMAVSYTEGSSPNPYEIILGGDASPGASGLRPLMFTRFNGGPPQLHAGNLTQFGTTAVSAGQPHGHMAVFNGASSSAAIDGVAYSISADIGSAGITNGIRTGGGDSGSFFNGPKPKHIVVTSGVLSADNALRLQGWMAYNGGGALSGNHPFATGSPILNAAVPVVRGSTIAQIAANSNVARLGTYSGYAATNPDGSSAIPPTPALLGKPVTTHKVYGSTGAQAWSGSSAGGETVESSILYGLGLLKGRGLQINLAISLATGSNPYYQFPGMGLSDAASGAADTMFTNVANYLIANGFADDPSKPVMLTYAQEQNGGTFPWASDGSQAWNAKYLAAARRQHDVMAPIFAAAGKPVLFGMAWNKGKPDLPWQDLAANYPGDAYCDFVGMDSYDDDLNYNLPQGYAGATGGNTAQTAAQRWQTSNVGLPDGSTGHLLAWLDLFARTPNMRGAGFIDGKALPIVIGEWAGGGPTSVAENDNNRSFALRQAYSGNDDGVYTASFMQWFKDHFVYAHYFYDIFDTSIGYTGAVKWTPANTNMSTAGYASTTSQVIPATRAVGTVANAGTTISGTFNPAAVTVGAGIRLDGVTSIDGNGNPNATIAAVTSTTITMNNPARAASAANATFTIAQVNKSYTFTVAAGLPFVVGMPLIVRDNGSPSANYMEATVTSYSGTTLVLGGFAAGGSGTLSAWQIYTHPNAVMPNSYAAIKAASQ